MSISTPTVRRITHTPGPIRIDICWRPRPKEDESFLGDTLRLAEIPSGPVLIGSNSGYPAVYTNTSIAPGSVSTVMRRASVAITSPSVATGIGAAQVTLMLRARPIVTCLRLVCVPSISFGM